MPVSKENCLNFSFKSSVISVVRPVITHLEFVQHIFVKKKKKNNISSILCKKRALTVKFVENLRHISLGLDGVNERVLVIFGVNHTHVIVILPT